MFKALLVTSIIFHLYILVTSVTNSIYTFVIERKFQKFLKTNTPAENSEKISILIPLRNEEHNLKNLMNSLTNLKYPNLEIILLDDNSTDKTKQILKSRIDKFEDKKNSNRSRIEFKLVNGKKLANGWLGKPFACYQLGKLAKGEILLFIDADVTITTRAVEFINFLISNQNYGMASLYPSQKTPGLTKLTVPFINFSVKSFVPLGLLNMPFVAPLAIGQTIAFDRTSYEKIGGHFAVKKALVEDVALARNCKRHNVLYYVGLSNKVTCKMYNTFHDSTNGFARYINKLFGNYSFPNFLVLLAITLLFLFPYLLLNRSQPTLFILSIFLICIQIITNLGRAVSNHNLLVAFLFPLRISTILLISILSLFLNMFNLLEWKGRKI